MKALHAAVFYPLSVEEYRRGAANTYGLAVLDVSGNQGAYVRRLLVGGKFFHVQFEFNGDFLNLFIIQRPIILQKLYMKFPEFTLFVGRQGCYGRRPGKLVAGQGGMFDNQFDIIGVFFQQLLELRLETSAIRSLVVVEYSNGNGCVGLSPIWGSICDDFADQIDAHHVDLLVGIAAQY